ncbi:hypothetical protein [Amycolatopsis sp. Poz14]|uniref:hypothetical protein n=1 Tax=Amycolatopsis sp. Poz14 TaxID=1447705 RepID=UPI001EE916D4|nr:hypothetical protein [Amycolatopsis sp. Poz14]MCG3757383.1 hypothetical protein [Amycolatopsis sp. Poz14]
MPDQSQQDPIESAAWAMWRADGSPTGTAKRDPYRKLARALAAQGLLADKTPEQRQSAEIALDALQRAAAEVLDILGPRYNAGGRRYSIPNLARKAAADLLRFDKIRAVFDSWGLDGEQMIRSLVQLADAKADRV